MTTQTQDQSTRQHRAMPAALGMGMGEGRQPEGSHGREFLSLAEAGELLGVGRCRAWELAHAGLLPAIRLGRRWYVPRRALEALVDQAIAHSQEALAPQEGK